jgi:DNA-binding GntR family transcriptional regulator
MSLKKESLKEKIASILMQRIIDGEIPLGEKIREAHLAKEFGVSQSPVREAITTLVSQGILEHQPNVGTHVKSCTKEETIEIYEVREALEIYVASKSAKGIKIDLPLMKRSYDDMLQAAQNEDLKSFVAHDQAFHLALLKTNNNTLLTAIWTQQYTRSSVQTVISAYGENLKDVVLMHLPIIEAIENNNHEALIVAIKAHYKRIIENL